MYLDVVANLYRFVCARVAFDALNRCTIPFYYITHAHAIALDVPHDQIAIDRTVNTGEFSAKTILYGWLAVCRAKLASERTPPRMYSAIRICALYTFSISFNMWSHMGTYVTHTQSSARLYVDFCSHSTLFDSVLSFWFVSVRTERTGPSHMCDVCVFVWVAACQCVSVDAACWHPYVQKAAEATTTRTTKLALNFFCCCLCERKKSRRKLKSPHFQRTRSGMFVSVHFSSLKTTVVIVRTHRGNEWRRIFYFFRTHNFFENIFFIFCR